MSSDSTSKPILVLDFDGVVHQYKTGWVDARVIQDPVTDGFFDWAQMAGRHFDLQIYSSRSSEPGGIDAMAAWLLEQRAKSGRLFSREIGFPTTKPAAFLTIDDRALNFTGNWSDFPMHELLNFKPWNRS